MSAIEELRMTILQRTNVFSSIVQVTLAQENGEELTKVLFLVKIYTTSHDLMQVSFFWIK